MIWSLLAGIVGAVGGYLVCAYKNRLPANRLRR